jgi:hypothetical protein
MDKVILLTIGLLLVWLAVIGKLGVFLACIFVPSTVQVRGEEES